MEMVVRLLGLCGFFIFLLDFFSPGHFRIQSTGVAIIYTATLVIYISNKEYIKWRAQNFISNYSGEFFIVLWTIVLFIFAISVSLAPDKFVVDSTFYTTYITVLGLFAITLNSKKLKRSSKINK